jgi:HEPN domain-containing protein
MRPAERIIDLAKELDKAYVLSRYPNAHPRGAPYEFYTKVEATKMLKIAREIVRYR